MSPLAYLTDLPGKFSNSEERFRLFRLSARPDALFFIYLLQSRYDGPCAPCGKKTHVMYAAFFHYVIDQVGIVPPEATLQPADLAPLAIST